jgi:hypothetical protein
MCLNATVMMLKHLFDPVIILSMPLAASTDAGYQVTACLKTALASVNYSSLPFGRVFDKLAFMAKSLQNSDCF